MFPNFEAYQDVNKAYCDFLEILMSVIDRIAPLKVIRTKNNTQEWFDGEVLEQICIRDKLYKKYKISNDMLTNIITRRPGTLFIVLFAKEKLNGRST